MRVHLCFLLAVLAPGALRLQFRCESGLLRASETREAFIEWQDMMLAFPQEHDQGGDPGVGGRWWVSRLTVSGRNYWKTLESTTSIRKSWHFLKKENNLYTVGLGGAFL